MYINARKQLGKDGIMNTWQLSEKGIILVIMKNQWKSISNMWSRWKEKNRGKWKIGIIENIFMGKDNTIRSIRLCTRKSVIERPIQLLCPMELPCNPKTTASNAHDDKTLNVNAEEFWPKRSAAAVAKEIIRDIADNENQWKTFDLHHQMGGEQCWNLKVTYNLMNYV